MSSIFGQANPTGVTGYNTTTETSTNYGVWFTVAKAGTLTGIWFYSHSGATTLPTGTALFSQVNVGSGTLLNSNASPTWSGAAGSGWVQDTSFPSTALTAGTIYLASYFAGSGGLAQAYIFTGSSPAAWFPTTSADGNITAPESEFSVMNGRNGGGTYTTLPNSSNANNLNWLVDVTVSFPSSIVALPVSPTPPGYQSPASWKQFPYNRLGQTITIAGSGGVAVPKPSLAGTASIGAAVTLPALQPMPPGALSPAAWQFPRYQRLLATTTIAGSGGVTVPKPSLAGTANETDSIILPAVQPMPPGALSPAAWQFPKYARLGQTITIAGSGGVVVPKPSLAGNGNVTRSVALPAVAPMPPGAVSPAAWQLPRYQRLGQVTTIAGSGGVTVPKPALAGPGIEFTETALPPLLPPGALSPAAWQFPRYQRLGQTITIAGSGGVAVPKSSLAGTGTEGTVPFTLPASQPMPPGYLSPAAWQAPKYPRLGQTITISGSGGVAVPKPVLAGNGTQGAIPFTVPASPLMPPGALSPAAWQRPQYRRLAQTITIQGSGGVTVPKPVLAGSGAVSVPSVFPAVQVTPPGYVSPAAWQAPRYVRAGQVTTIAGSGGVAVPKPSLAATGNATANAFALPALQPMPPGALSPAAWQRPRYQRLGQTVTISGSGGVTAPKPSLAGTGTVTAVQQWTLRQQAIPPGFTSPMAFQRAVRPASIQAPSAPRPGTVTITDTAEYAVTITDEMIGAVTISNKINGTVTIGNAT